MIKKFFCVFLILYLFCTTCCGCNKNATYEENITPKSNIKVISKKSQNCELHLVKLKEHNILINCEKKENIKETINFLKENNAQKIDYLILTDFSEDNLGSANVILRKLTVDNIIQPSYMPKNSELYKTYIEVMKFKELSPLCVKEDETIKVEDINITFFGCNNQNYNNDSENCSLVFKISYFKNSLLFLGNIKEERMANLTEKNVSADFIKISNKIKYNKTLKTFIKKSNPTYCYISCSKNTPANSQMKDFLKRKNIKLYYSYENDYTFVSNGISITSKKGIN